MRVRERGSLFFAERESERETDFARARERERARESEKERECVRSSIRTCVALGGGLCLCKHLISA
jgi:hypothetical protein